MDKNEIETLRDRLQNRGPEQTLESIAFGAGLSLSWLTKFKLRKIAEPRLKNYQALKRYMDRQQSRAA
jgi:hypothetical protein